MLVGRRASWRFRRRVCSWGKLGLLRLGMQCYLATPEPQPRWFGLPNTPQTILSASEVVTIGILYAVKGVSQRAFYPGSATTTDTRSPNCRNAPTGFAACTPNATGPGASGPPLR